MRIASSTSRPSAVGCAMRRSWTVGMCTPAPTSSRWASSTAGSEKANSEFVSLELDELPGAMRIRRGDGHLQRLQGVFAGDERWPLLFGGVEEILELFLQRLLFADVDLLCVVLERDLVEV